MKKRILILMGVCIIALSGCGGNTSSNSESVSTTETSSAASEEGKDALESVLSSNDEVKEESNEAESIDADALAKELLSSNSFEEELSFVDLSSVEMFYNFVDIEIKDAAFYESSGATAEEVAVVVCENEESADKMVASFETRVEEQIENFTDYVPKELKKLEKYSVNKDGNVVTFVVAIAE